MKRNYTKLIILMLLILVAIPHNVEAGTTPKNVYVVPVEGEIGPAVYEYLKDQLRLIDKDPNVAAIIFEVNTQGGRIDSAVEISNLILNVPHKTISFVNNKATSAGVLITISADVIAMSSGSTIGSAEPIPNTEKILSYWTSELRSVAQTTGRDENLVVAMADQSIEIQGIIEKGRLLNLTAKEAEKISFSDLTAENHSEILNYIGLEYTNIQYQPKTLRLRLAQFATSIYVTPILLTMAFIGLLFEIFIPGFGLGGTVSVVSFALYFGGGILAGNVGWSVLLLLIAGLTLLLVEAMAPGFGVAGVGGLICIAISIILAANNVAIATISLFISLILTILAFIMLLKYAPRNKFFDRIILSTKLEKDKGYTSVKEYDQYLEQEGIVKTFLRPAGTIEVNGEVLDVVSEGEFVERGAKVKVINVEGRKIIVRKAD